MNPFWRPYTELQNACLNPPARFKCDVAPVCQVIPTDHFTSWVQENTSSQKSRMVRAFSYWDVKWGNLSYSSVPAGRLWNKPSNGFSSQVDSGDEALSTAAPTTIILIPCRLFSIQYALWFGQRESNRRFDTVMVEYSMLEWTYERTCPNITQQVNPNTENEIHMQTSMKNQMEKTAWTCLSAAQLIS